MPCRLLLMTRLMSACAGVERADGWFDVAALTSRPEDSAKRLAAWICSAVMPPTGGGDVGDVPEPEPFLPRGNLPFAPFEPTTSFVSTLAGGTSGATGGGATAGGLALSASSWAAFARSEKLGCGGGAGAAATAGVDGLRRTATATIPQRIATSATAPPISLSWRPERAPVTAPIPTLDVEVPAPSTTGWEFDDVKAEKGAAVGGPGRGEGAGATAGAAAVAGAASSPANISSRPNEPGARATTVSLLGAAATPLGLPA